MIEMHNIRLSVYLAHLSQNIRLESVCLLFGIRLRALRIVRMRAMFTRIDVRRPPACGLAFRKDGGGR